MVRYDPICGYISIGMYMEVDPMKVPWYVEEYFEEYFETLVVGGMVFGTPHVWGLWRLEHIEEFKGIRTWICK